VNFIETIKAFFRKTAAAYSIELEKAKASRAPHMAARAAKREEAFAERKARRAKDSGSSK
jgi:hypothetical protein